MLYSPNSARGKSFVSKGIAFDENVGKIYGVAKTLYGAFQVAAPYIQMAAAGL
jgi:hypothetical protein